MLHVRNLEHDEMYQSAPRTWANDQNNFAAHLLVTIIIDIACALHSP